MTVWQDFTMWVSNYSTGIIAFLSAAGMGTALLLLKKYGIKIGQRFLTIAIKIVTKLFGGSVNEDEMTIAFNALPFVQDLKAQVDHFKEDNEMKLIEIKKKLLSPKLSEVERIAYTYQYEQLSRKMEAVISESTKAIIEKMETAARKINL